MGGFAGFMDIAEEPEMDDWFEKTSDHVTVAGGYTDVSIFMTDKGFGTEHRWCRTDMNGVLRLMLIKDAENYPLVVL